MKISQVIYFFNRTYVLEELFLAISLSSKDDPLYIPPLLPKSPNLPPTNILIIVNLPRDMDENALGTLFSAVAPVEDASIGRDEISGHPLGFGLVKYFHSKDANNAFKIMNLFPLSQENVLRVSPYYPGVTRIKKFERTNLLVQNIPPGTQEIDVFRYFVKFGCVVSCALMFPGDHAFVRYESVADAMTAVAESDGLQFPNTDRKLIVTFNTFIQIKH